MSSAPFGFPALLTSRRVAPDVEMPDGLPVSGGQGSPLVDAFLALQGGRIKDAVTAPSRALSGDLQVWDPETGHTTDAARDAASGMAGLAMTGSLGMPVPKGALRTFGGAVEHDPLAALEAALGDLKPRLIDSTPRSFVDPSAKSWDLYHGTAAPVDFDRFSTSLPDHMRPNTNGSSTQAQAVFLSPSPDEAAHYALGGGVSGAGASAGPRTIRATVDPGNTRVFDLPHLMETDPAFRERVWRTGVEEYERARGPLDPAQSRRFRSMFDDNMRTVAEDNARVRAFNDEHGHLGARDFPTVPYGYGGASAAIRQAIDEGLDTAVIRGLGESNGGDQVVALTPGRVRSYYDPSQVLYAGGPSGAAAGLPALAASTPAESPPSKGAPVSAGFNPFGIPAFTMPDELPGLVARMVAAGPAPKPEAPAGPAPAGAAPTFPGLVDAPTPMPQDRPTPPLPNLVGGGLGFPAMPRPAPAADLPAPASVPAQGRMPLGIPAPASPAPAAAPSADSGSLFDGFNLENFRKNGGADLLSALGQGLLSSPTWGKGVATGLKLDGEQSDKRAVTDLARAKTARELGAQNATRRYLLNNGLDDTLATAAMGSPAVLQSVLNQLHKNPSVVEVGGNKYSLRPGEKPTEANLLGPAQSEKDRYELLDTPEKRAAAGVAPTDPRTARMNGAGKVEYDSPAPAPTVHVLEDENGIKHIRQYDPTTRSWIDPAQPPGAPPAPTNPYALKGKITGDQAKAAGFADRMLASEEILAKNAGQGAGFWARMGSGVPLVGNYLSSNDYQSFEQAKRDFMNAQLRRESGAAIGKDEFSSADQQYFPVPGDSDATIKQKAANRRTAVEAMIREGGQTYLPRKVFDDTGNLVPFQGGQRGAAPSAPGLRRFNPLTGGLD